MDSAADLPACVGKVIAEIVLPYADGQYSCLCQRFVGPLITELITRNLFGPIFLVISGHDEVLGALVEEATVSKDGDSQIRKPPVRFARKIGGTFDQFLVREH